MPLPKQHSSSSGGSSSGGNGDDYSNSTSSDTSISTRVSNIAEVSFDSNNLYYVLGSLLLLLGLYTFLRRRTSNDRQQILKEYERRRAQFDKTVEATKSKINGEGADGIPTIIPRSGEYQVVLHGLDDGTRRCIYTLEFRQLSMSTHLSKLFGYATYDDEEEQSTILEGLCNGVTGEVYWVEATTAYPDAMEESSSLPDEVPIDLLMKGRFSSSSEFVGGAFHGVALFDPSGSPNGMFEEAEKGLCGPDTYIPQIVAKKGAISRFSTMQEA